MNTWSVLFEPPDLHVLLIFTAHVQFLVPMVTPRSQETITLKQRSVQLHIHAPEYRNKYWRGWFTWQPRLLKIVPPK